jgi:Flp pilus assembly secretin CpaC
LPRLESKEDPPPQERFSNSFTNLAHKQGVHVELPRMRHSITALALAACLIAMPAVANETVIAVSLDRATVIKAPPNTAMVVIGNPGIADVSVQKNGVMVLTGKSFGETNMIALNDKGEMISESWLRVRPSQRGTSVTLFRAGEPETYSCAPDCRPTVSLGDAQDFFARSGGQAGARNGFAQSGQPK